MRETNFKQTEIGQFPADWKEFTIQDLGPISKGKGISRAECGTGNIPCVRYGEIYTDHDNYIKRFRSFISKDVAKTSRKLQYGELLFTGSGETKEDIGKCVAFVGNEEAYAGGDIVIVSPDLKENDPLFLGFLMNDRYIVNQKALRGQGDAVVHITGKTLSTVQMVLPTHDEQRRIAKALSDMDGLISSLNKLIDKKQNIKTATMQELLSGKKRLDGFTEPWVESSINENFSIVGNNCVSRNEMSTSGNVRNIHYGDVLIKFGSVINADVVELPYIIGRDKARHPLCDGDIIMADTAEDETCGKVCEVRGVGDSMIESGLHTIALRPRKEFGRNFLGYYMNSASFHDLLLPLMQGTKVTSISKSALMEVNMSVPSSVEEQTIISSILTDMDNEISALETKKAKYESIKKGMMQELLTGKIRLV